MFTFIKKLTPIATLTCVLSATNLITLNSALAYSVNFSNGDFQTGESLSNSSGWEGVGSTAITGTYSGVDYNGTNQGAITTACLDGSLTECNNRNDDDPTSIGTFNLLDKDQRTASPEIGTLQSDLNLSANALSIYREIDGVTYDGTNGNPELRRTVKEGSAIFQDITITDDGSSIHDFKLTFNYDFLTNDGAGGLGDKDFGFVSISGNGIEEVIVLEDSTGSIPTASGSNFQTNTNAYQSYTVNNLSLTPGVYRVGFGVVDVDGVGRSSGLLLDEAAMEEVPFEFSPTAGLGLVLGLMGVHRLRSRFKK